MCSRIACMLGAFTLLSACKSTPLDVVYGAEVAGAAGAATAFAAGAGGAGASGAGASGAGATGAGASGAGTGGAEAAGGSGGSMGDAGSCSIVGPGRYVLRSRADERCLGQGAPTSVFGSPAFTLDLSTDCQQAERFWQLRATPIPNVFTIQNLSSSVTVPGSPAFVLDVEMAATTDGTRVITFGETGFDNQRFEVRARDTFVSELRPQHHPQSCMSTTGSSAQITTCVPSDGTQGWLLQRSDCL